MKHYWKTKDGAELDISTMETSHIKNCIRMLEKNAKTGAVTVWGVGYAGDDDFETGEVETFYGKEYLAATEYKWLVKELKSRLSAKS